MVNPMAYAMDPRNMMFGGGVGVQADFPGSVSSPEAVLGIAGGFPGMPVGGAPLASSGGVPPAQGSGQAGTPPPAAGAPATAPAAPETPARDPLCSASIEHLRAHGVPGKPGGWLERVERELCSPEIAPYDIPICPERQAMKFGTTYTRQVDTLGSPSASARESARKTLETRMRAAPFNRGLLPGPDGVLRRERQCGLIVGPRTAAPAATEPIEQIPPTGEDLAVPAPGTVSLDVVIPPRPPGVPFVPLPTGRAGAPMPTGYKHPSFTHVILPRPGISRPNESREVENGGLVWDAPDFRDPAGFLGLLDPSDVDSAGMFSYRPSQGGLPYDPAAAGRELPTADGSLMQLRSTSDFRVVFDETGDIWSAYS
jgi:hypothetical protein